MGGQPGFFDVEDRLKRLSDLGDQLEAFARAVEYEQFRPTLDATLAYADGAKGGRPPLDPVMMCKVLVIQAANNLSDERAEYLVNYRLSFMRFLGLGLGDRVPDARTIWLFRERLTRALIDGRPAIEVLFARFDETLRAAGYIAMSGQIVDATLVAAPRQRNTEEEKAAIKAGRVPTAWQAKPAKLRHKDRESDGAVHPHGGAGASAHEDRAGQSRLQCQTADLSGAAVRDGCRLTPAGCSRTARQHQSSAPSARPTSDPTVTKDQTRFFEPSKFRRVSDCEDFARAAAHGLASPRRHLARAGRHGAPARSRRPSPETKAPLGEGAQPGGAVLLG